jgi:hypothetical protein
MNHEHIDAADVRSRYVTRRLSSDEERAFEEHLVDCAECQDDVEREIDLRDGLRQLPPPRSEPRSVREQRALGVSLLAAAAAVLLVVSATLAITLRSTSSELRAARAAASELERRAASADSSAAALSARLAAAERLGAAAEKSAATAIVFLTSVRGASGGRDAINRVTIAGGITSLVFSIELDQPARGAEFTASVADAAGSEIWRGGPFRAYAPDALAVSVDAAPLHDGEYVLTLERRAQDGRLSSVTHRLRVTRQE